MKELLFSVHIINDVSDEDYFGTSFVLNEKELNSMIKIVKNSIGIKLTFSIFEEIEEKGE